VDATVARLKRALPNREVSGVVKEGYVIECILEEASDWNADLIVVGSHGRSGLSRLFLGSVAESVLTQAPCSVEIAKLQPIEICSAEKSQTAVVKS
jgi:nucleotide-binding universal stress UspA family protein